MANASVLPEPVFAAAEHVAPGKGVGQGVDLDGKGFGNSRRGECRDEGCWHAERAEW